MINAAEVQTNASVTASTGQAKDENVDPDLFARELGSKLSSNDRAAIAMEKLAAAFPGVTISNKGANIEDVRQYSIRSDNGSSVNINPDLMLQMAEDDDTFNQVSDMVKKLFEAGKQQQLVNSGGSNVHRNVTIDGLEVRYVEVQRTASGTQMSVSALTMLNEQTISETLDMLLGNRNGSNAAADNSTGFTGIAQGSSSWRFQSFVSSQSLTSLIGSRQNGMTQMLQANQSFTANLEVMIEEWSSAGGSGVDFMTYIQWMGLSDPLVLDLGDEGINLRSAEDGVYFDIKGDGSPVQTAFIQGNNAFLYLDENGNGVADDVRELFGDYGGYANGYEKLAQYDDNGDGVIDENDAIYSQLRVWRDLNGDGVNQENESMTLAEAGVKSLNLKHDNSKRLDDHGNVIADQSFFTRFDGSQGLMADVWLRSRGR